MIKANRYYRPGERRLSWRRVLRFFAWGLPLFAVAHLADHWAYHHWLGSRSEYSDWHRMLRVLGFMPLWLILALLLAAYDMDKLRTMRWPDALARPILLVASPIVAGALAAILKVISRRQRPEHGYGDWTWRPWTDGPFDGGGIGLPSGHTAVAMAGMLMLAYFFPRGRLVFIALGVGCAMTRVMASAHFVSDVVMSILVAVAVQRTLCWLYERRWTYRRLIGTLER